MDIKYLYDSGICFEEFMTQDDGAYIEKISNIYDTIELDDDLLAKIQSIDKEVRVLAFAEIWCPDCVINLPALKKICDLNNFIKMKIVSREGNEEYLNDHRIDGKPKIPTFLFLDEEFKEIGAFIEIPSIIKQVMSNGSQVDIIVTKRKYRKGELIEETIKDILKIII
ncbi:thioredoxin family protein [Wukongibacter sp. M2B1]|uniref:thioredoxin family protein n=1 Tax=Wukongibacter sp. M2B1 TaxID=3088895 RepID=UPI003D7B243A